MRQSHEHPFARAHCKREIDSTALVIAVVTVLSFSFPYIVLYTRWNCREVPATKRKCPRPRNLNTSAMISSEKSEIPNKRGLLRVMLLFFCIAHQVVCGMVIIMRIVVSCDIATK